MTPAVTLTLPWPPSVNSIYVRKRRGFALSARVQSYRDSVAALCYQQHARRWRDEQVSVTIVANPPDAKPRDLDNVLKALLDALEECAVLDDDVNVNRIVIERGPIHRPKKATKTGPRKDGGQVVVTIERWEPSRENA